MSDPNHRHPFLVFIDAVIDYLTALVLRISIYLHHVVNAFHHRKIGVPIEDLDRGSLTLVIDIPMVHGRIGHQAQAVRAVPFPENHIFIHGGGLELLLLRQIEDLQRPRLSSEGDNLFIPVHDGGVSLDRSLGDFIVVLEIDDDHLAILSNANIAVRL